MNTTPFTNWFWKYCWMTNDPNVVPHIALETDALTADPDSTEPRYFIDYVIVVDDSNIFVHMENPVKH